MAEKARYVIPGAENNALASSLACIPFADGLRLCHVDYDGSIYCLNENLPYVTAGSGKINADPFLRFIWDVFWPDPGHLPPLREAIFAAYWTVQMNIEYQSMGVGIGVDVWTVDRNADGSYAATETDWSRLEPSGMFIESMKQAMRAQRDLTFRRGNLPAELPPRL